MKKVNLFIASHHFFPTHGGVTLRFLHYFPGLRQRGIYARVLAGTPKAAKYPKAEMPEEWVNYSVGEILPAEEYEGTSITRIRLPDKAGEQRSHVFNNAILDFCRQDGYRPHVVQLLGSLHPRTRPWLVRLRKLEIPIIYAYTTPPHQLPAAFLKRIRRKLEYRMLYRQLDCVVAQSTVMKRILRDHGVRVPIEVIPNGVNLQRFHPAADSDERRGLRASLGLPQDGRILITVGSVSATKGSDFLLEAWAKLTARFPDLNIVIVGTLFDTGHPKQGKFRRKIDNLVSASGAADRIHFSDFVSNVDDYLRASDLFAFPSLKEAMPNVVLEAMASGLATILTPLSSLPEEFGKPDREYILVERKPDVFASAIADLLGNDERRMNLGRQARNWVEKTMDIELVLDRYANLYHRMGGYAH